MPKTPLIKVQRLANHPKRTAFIACFAAIALIIGIVVVVVNYESSQTRTTKLLQSTIDTGRSRSDVRWCGLFNALIVQNSPPNPTSNQEQSRAALIKLATEFSCIP